MKILHVYKASLPTSYGGVETFIDTLCKHSAKLGVINTVFTLNTAPQPLPIKMDGYTVCQSKQDFFIASTGFSVSAFSKFNDLANDADLIHYHFPNPFADILHLTCNPKKPSIVTYHSDIINQKYWLKLYQPLRWCFFNSIDHVVSTSPNYFVTSDVLQKYAEKVSIIPIGIDHKVYGKALPERLKYWQQKLPQPFFLFIGSMRYYKGLHLALEAVAGTNLNIVIGGINGIEKALRARANSLHLKNVHFLGFVTENDKAALLHLCHGFIFPSHLRAEAFGIALLEAATVGKPLISCEIGTGTTFINQANKTGLVINPGSYSELRDAMQFLLDNPKIAAKMGKNAKKRSLELFTADQQASSYLSIYKKLLSKYN